MIYSSIVIKHRSIANKYLCYDSFKADFFWGPRHLSETFQFTCFGSEIMKRLLRDIPEGRKHYLRENNRDDATVEEMGLL